MAEVRIVFDPLLTHVNPAASLDLVACGAIQLMLEYFTLVKRNWSKVVN